MGGAKPPPDSEINAVTKIVGGHVAGRHAPRLVMPVRGSATDCWVILESTPGSLLKSAEDPTRILTVGGNRRLTRDWLLATWSRSR